MKFPFYQGEGFKQKKELPVKLPLSKRAQLLKPEKYSFFQIDEVQ